MSESSFTSASSTPSPSPLCQSRPESRAEEDVQQEERMVCLKTELWSKLSKLEMPDIGPVPLALQTKLYEDFCSSTNPSDFARKVEMELKAHHPDLAVDFTLGAKEEKQIEQIPYELALDYMKEQRLVLEDGVHVTKENPMGWDTLAGNLSDRMGFRYEKGGCKTFLSSWLEEQQTQSPNSDIGSKCQHRSRSSERDTLYKFPRKARGSISPPKLPVINAHSLAARKAENTTINALSNKLRYANTCRSRIRSPGRSILSQESLRDVVTINTSGLERLLQDTLAQHRAEIKAKLEKQYAHRIWELEEICKAFKQTASSALSQSEEVIKILSAEKLEMSLENEKLKSCLEAQQINNMKMREEVHTSPMTKEVNEENPAFSEADVDNQNELHEQADITATEAEDSVPVPTTITTRGIDSPTRIPSPVTIASPRIESPARIPSPVTLTTPKIGSPRRIPSPATIASPRIESPARIPSPATLTTPRIDSPRRIPSPATVTTPRIDSPARIPSPGTFSAHRMDFPTRTPSPGSFSTPRIDSPARIPSPGTFNAMRSGSPKRIPSPAHNSPAAIHDDASADPAMPGDEQQKDSTPLRDSGIDVPESFNPGSLFRPDLAGDDPLNTFDFGFNSLLHAIDSDWWNDD